MIIIDQIEQGTKDWFRAKLGVVSASRATEYATESKLAPMPDEIDYYKDKEGHHYKVNGEFYIGSNKSEVEKKIRETLPRIYGDMRQSYMCELVGQVVTCNLPEEITFKQCEWGHEYEDEARAHLELLLEIDVDIPAFIYRDKEKRFGISPDGILTKLYKGKKTGLELKCPFTTKVFIEFATCEKIKQMYVEQCQYSMWVTGYEQWIFANYDPRIKNKKNRLHHVIIERDQIYMDKYDNAEKPFIKDMDLMLDKMGVEFGHQWED